MKVSYFLKYDTNASRDEKIIKLRAKQGFEGYGVFWAILEALANTTDGTLEYDIGLIETLIGYGSNKVKEIVETLIELNLLNVKNNRISNKRVLVWMEDFLKRQKKAKKAITTRWKNTPSNTPSNTDKIRKDKILILSDKKEDKKTKAQPSKEKTSKPQPTPEELKKIEERRVYDKWVKDLEEKKNG